jgi:hypothetical protein
VTVTSNFVDVFLYCPEVGACAPGLKVGLVIVALAFKVAVARQKLRPEGWGVRQNLTPSSLLARSSQESGNIRRPCDTPIRQIANA